MTSRPSILLIEDSPEDFEMIVRAFRSSGLVTPIQHCADGDDALDRLHRRGAYADAAVFRPAIVLLDLTLPGTSGYEVLAAIKADEELRTIPVIVLTTSADPHDVTRCYRAGANSYVAKPVEARGFMEVIARLKTYWLEINVLPTHTGAPEPIGAVPVA